jgi:hypothetical protein
VKARAPALASREITLALPTSAADVAALQRDAESDAPTIRAITIADAGDYEFADAILTDVVRKKDAVVAMRKSATGPLYGVIRTVEGWFKPVVSALEASERHLKSAMGAWRLELDTRERAAREAAAVAAESGDAGAMLEAINAANAASPDAVDGRATVRFTWVIKRIAEDLLPDEWWTPDVARISALAEGDGEPPVIPGVIWEKVPHVGARR